MVGEGMAGTAQDKPAIGFGIVRMRTETFCTRVSTRRDRQHGLHSGAFRLGRSRLASLMLVVALISGACSSGEPGSVEDSTTPSESADPIDDPPPAAEDTVPLVEQTAWDRLMDQIGPDGEVPIDMALQAFTLAIGPLPGVDTPEGDPGTIVSGTGPLRWVLGHWDSLTEEQQAAVEGYLPAPDIPSASGIPSTLAASTPVPTGFSAGLLSGTARIGNRREFQQDVCLLDQELEQVVADVLAAIEAGFDRELTVSARACRTLAPHPLALPYNAEGGFLDGTMSRCELTVGDESGSLLTFNVAYQLFNCFQADLMTIDKWHELPPWLNQGTAFWVAMTTADVNAYDTWWQRWLTRPERRLFSRGPDAVGFYSLMDEAGVPANQHIDRMLIEWVRGGNEDAYAAAAASSEQLLDEWGPGYFADEGKGDAWFFTGPGITGQANAASEVTVANGDKRAISSVPYAATPTVALLSADVVVFGAVGGALGLVWEAESSVSVTDELHLGSFADARLVFTYEPFLEENDLEIPAPPGRIYLPDGSDKRLTEALGAAYCMLPGGCECPQGSPGDNRMTTPGTDAFAYIGITGHTTATDFVVEGHSLETYCELGPAGRANYVLTGGSWTWNFNGGVAINGCVWPSAFGSGTFSYDPDSFLDIDTSQSPPRYWANAITSESAGKVEVSECEVDGVRKYETFEWSADGVAGGIWFGLEVGDPWLPLTGDVVSGTRSWGDPVDIATWTLTRQN